MFHEAQVNIYVNDVERMVAFYTTHLGFVESFRTPQTGIPEHVEARLGGLVLGFASVESARTVHGLDVTSGGAGAEVVVWTDDTDGVYARLIAAGAESMREPHDFLGRLRAAWVRDPEGNPVEVVAERVAR